MKQNHHVDWNIPPISNVWDWVMKSSFGRRTTCPFAGETLPCFLCNSLIRKQLLNRPNFDITAFDFPCPCHKWGCNNVVWAAMQILKQHENA
jgi:hypothetical protein